MGGYIGVRNPSKIVDAYTKTEADAEFLNDSSDAIKNAVTANTAKTGITSGQSSAITANTTTASAALPKAGGTMTGNISHGGNLALDVAGVIVLDADNQGSANGVQLKDSGIHYGSIFRSSSNFHIKSIAEDKDLIFMGNDGGNEITALTLDMSDAGTAIFNNKVGIGTSSPSSFYSLASNLVVGTGTGGNGMTIYSGSSDSGYIGFNDTASNAMQAFIQYNHNGNYMAFAPNGSEKMRIDNSGKVGIGTNSPNTMLHVDAPDGTTYPTLGTASGVLGLAINEQHGMYLGVDGSSGNGWIQPMREDGTGTAYDLVLQPSGGSVSVGTNSTSSKLEVNGDIGIGRVAGGYTFREVVGGGERAGINSDANNHLIFNTSNASESMRINDSGNVGIGTNSPKRHLHIGGTGTTKIQITNNTTGSSSDGDGFQLGISTDGTAGIEQRENADLTFSANNTERMRIKSSGNVGIGTNNPQRPLHVNGNEGVARFTSTNSGNNGFEVGIGTSSQAFLWQAENSHMEFATNNTERMRINAAGGLSITDGLTIGTNTAIINNTSGSVFNNDRGGAIDFRVKSGAYNHAFFVDSGTDKIGMNTSSPTRQLSIENTIANSGGQLGLTSSNSSTSGSMGIIHFGNSTDSSLAAITAKSDGTTSNGALLFKTEATGGNIEERMRISSTGIVVIGATDPVRFGIQSKTLIVNSSATTTDFALHISRVGTGTENVVSISNGYGKVGSITTSGTSASFNTSSDYRLKENVVSLTGASARVNQLDVKRFNWITDDTNTAIDGFLAHEVATVVPEAVNGDKDAMRDEEYEVTPAVLDEDDNVTTEAVMGTRSVPDYQGIDQSKLVPLLTAALQEALAKIDAMETRLTALEG